MVLKGLSAVSSRWQSPSQGLVHVRPPNAVDARVPAVALPTVAVAASHCHSV